MKRKERLIIFYKNPELGKVKTRLAATVGEEMALAVYFRLASHTRTVVSSVSADKVVYYSQAVDFEDEWKDVHKAMQKGSDLGERMHHAFEESFALGYESVCIIGTDCWQLEAKHLQEAFEQLITHEVVIGPATDGGYYLLGMKQMHAQFFQDKVWSSDTVLSRTLTDLKTLHLTFHLLPSLSDVDEEKDLPNHWRSII